MRMIHRTATLFGPVSEPPLNGLGHANAACGEVDEKRFQQAGLDVVRGYHNVVPEATSTIELLMPMAVAGLYIIRGCSDPKKTAGTVKHRQSGQGRLLTRAR